MKKIVLSWDVGIKNLAFCLLEIKDQTFKILKWDSINLASNRATCCFVKGTHKCDKIATMCINIDKPFYCCSSHISKIDVEVHDVDIGISIVNNNDLCKKCKKLGIHKSSVLDGQYCQRHFDIELKKLGRICSHPKCTEYATKSLYKNVAPTDNLVGWCDNHVDDVKAYLAKKTKKLSHNCNKISIDALACSMYQQLDKYPEFMQADEVLIENQPTFINPTMKTVSALLYGYFIMRGIYERTKTGSAIKSVNFCSPTNKLKVAEQNTELQLQKAPTNKVYKITKKLGVQYCSALIADNNDNVRFLASHKKKDDLCDAFLQGFIKSFPIVPAHYYEKLQEIGAQVDE